MPGVFISYRKIDSAGFSGRLCDHLSRHFGPEQVFIDVDDINHGADYTQVIRSSVGEASAMVVVIGRQWLACTDARGNRRLDDPADWVRNEVAEGLRRDILVLPVLVDGAAMPAAEHLPPGIAPLAYKQAGEISNARWQYDLDGVTRTLERVVMPVADAPRNRLTRLGKLVWNALAGVAIATMTMIVLLIVLIWNADDVPSADIATPTPEASLAVKREATVPQIGGLGYDQARKLLIEKGWTPTRHAGDAMRVTTGNGPVFWKREYREVDACAGTRTAPCLFRFSDASGRVLVVVTEGKEASDGSAHATVALYSLPSGRQVRRGAAPPAASSPPLAGLVSSP